MVKKLVLAAAVLAMTSLGLACGGSVCDRMATTSTSLDDKAKGCSSSDGGVTISASKFNKATCEANVANCTADDQKILNTQMDCMGKIAACTTGNELAYAGSLLSCSTDASKISTACSAAFSGN
jgi:hypothetical protein